MTQLLPGLSSPPYFQLMNGVYKFGFGAGVLAFIFTISYVVIQLLQVQRFIPYPLDEMLIYGSSLLIVIPFVVEMAALYYITLPAKKFWTQLALIFTTLYAVFVSANYVVQLATVLPMKLKGMGSSVSLLEQTPHSMFWNFDALGYIFMGIAMLFAAQAVDSSGHKKFTKFALLANGWVTPLISIVYFYPSYSEKLLMLGYPWAITAPLAMLSVALLFFHEMRQATKTKPETYLPG